MTRRASMAARAVLASIGDSAYAPRFRPGGGPMSPEDRAAVDAGKASLAPVLVPRAEAKRRRKAARRLAQFRGGAADAPTGGTR